MDLDLEYKAAIKQLRRMKRRAPRKYSTVMLAVGLTEASDILDEIEYRTPDTQSAEPVAAQ